MKKILDDLLVATAVVSLAACSGEERKASLDVSIKDRYELGEKTPAWKLGRKKGPTKIKWYINSDWTALPFGKDVTTAQIKKNLNMDIEFIPGDDLKSDAIIPSGDIPDIVALAEKTEQMALKVDSWVYSLSDLAKKYDPYLMKVVSQDTSKRYTLEDGKIYGCSSYSNTKADYESGNIPVSDSFVIYESVYSALGKPDIPTPENFEEVMQQIREKYPEMTPMGFTTAGDGVEPFLDRLQDFLGVPLEDKNGKYYDRNLDKEYPEWLKTSNDIYRASNVSNDSFADNGATFDEKVK